MQEDINSLKICMNGIKKDIEYIKVSLDNNKEEHKILARQINKWIETSEKRFAPIWVAKVMIWGGSIIGAAIIIAILSQILK